MQHAIFVGYRRDDTGDAAGRIYDRLEAHFGQDRVFQDVQGSIPLGMQFRDYISSVVEKCRVFLALIGPGWIGITNTHGARRLDDPDDLVRIEIETALRTPGVQVVPVLVNGASALTEESLPESLRPLANLQAAQVRRDDFRGDMERLIRALALGEETGRVEVQAPMQQAPIPTELVQLAVQTWADIEKDATLEDVQNFRAAHQDPAFRSLITRVDIRLRVLLAQEEERKTAEREASEKRERLRQQSEAQRQALAAEEARAEENRISKAKLAADTEAAWQALWRVETVGKALNVEREDGRRLRGDEHLDSHGWLIFFAVAVLLCGFPFVRGLLPEAILLPFAGAVPIRAAPHWAIILTAAPFLGLAIATTNRLAMRAKPPKRIDMAVLETFLTTLSEPIAERLTKKIDTYCGVNGIIDGWRRHDGKLILPVRWYTLRLTAKTTAWIALGALIPLALWVGAKWTWNALFGPREAVAPAAQPVVQHGPGFFEGIGAFFGDAFGAIGAFFVMVFGAIFGFFGFVLGSIANILVAPALALLHLVGGVFGFTIDPPTTFLLCLALTVVVYLLSALTMRAFTWDWDNVWLWGLQAYALVAILIAFAYAVLQYGGSVAAIDSLFSVVSVPRS